MNPNSDAEIHSPNEMMVDPDDYVVELPQNEKDDIAIINPDQLDGMDEIAALPRADDYEAMKELIFTPLPEDPPIVTEGVHTWKIEHWRNLPKKEHGPIFEVGGYPWRVLFFPSGNNVEFCSFYLEHGFEDNKPPEDWYCCVQFSLVLWNPNDPTIYTHHTAYHRFTPEEGDWGFTRFSEIRRTFGVNWENGSRPLVENDCANMTAYVRVVKDETGVLWHNFTNYDSKKQTGYVGLKNQGATCYLNSLIQSLYLTNAFRKAVYQIPTQDEETLSNSAYTLQRLFYQLQTSQQAVSTNELTRSFGWETRHIFEQQDVQELSRKLMERMEEKMKGTAAQNVLPQLFCGKVKTYISCINVDYESSRVEDFWDVQLNVSGNRTIEDSFRDYVQVEKMDGENQYFAGDKFRLQDANKGVIFQSFPEVLHLQLKRFEYDIERDAMMKINDRYEFPETFDASPYLSEDADKSESYVYQLHGVLVHSGDLNAGHYYAFIKPAKDGWFYKYDDDRVTKATMREVLEENYGGPMLNASKTAKPQIRANSAYMLVYIRQSRLDNVLCPVTEADTPPHLQRKLDEEAALKEAKRKEREEQHLYLNVKVLTEDAFKAHSGTDLGLFDVNVADDPAGIRLYRLLRLSTVNQLKVRIGEDIGQDPRKLRLWYMVNRQNKTTRPDQPIIDPSLTIEEAQMKLGVSKQVDLRVWAEVAEEVNADGEPIWPSYQTTQAGARNDNILIFLKWFDIETQILKGVGHIYIGKERRVEELVSPILKKMGWPETTSNGDLQQLKLFEEIKPQMIEAMKAKQTLKAAELQDGDIVSFQKPVKSASNSGTPNGQETVAKSTQISSTTGLFEDVRQYYDHLLYKKHVRFHPHARMQQPQSPTFDLVLSAKNTYDQFAAKVGEKLGVNPTHIRFHTINASNGNPKTPVKRNPTFTLHQILNPPYSTFGNNNQRSDSLYYEVLDISLSELDTKKNFKVQWLTEGITKDETFDVLVNKTGTIDDLIAALVRKADISAETEEFIRVYEVQNHKIYKELNRDFAVSGISDFCGIVAERVPDEELNAEPNSFINAFHFQNDPNKAHGIPFKFHIKPDEKFSETKKRLEARTGLKGKNFEKIKFAVVVRSSYAKPQYLTDDDVLWGLAHDDDLLGLDHTDRSRAVRAGAGDLFLK